MSHAIRSSRMRIFCVTSSFSVPLSCALYPRRSAAKRMRKIASEIVIAIIISSRVKPEL
jgi:hypothetical protein